MKLRRQYMVPFFLSYFFYYSGYCVFSSFIVLYLTKQGFSAALCGLITSMSLLANVCMEPVGGYITDTFLSMKRYLIFCIAAIALICVFCTWQSGPVVFILMILMAGISYSFGQLMDAWVEHSKTQDHNLEYGTIRAGGSIGFALMSFAAGYYFECFGWKYYFLLQAVMFLLMLPFLFLLPANKLGNKKQQGREEDWLSFFASFRMLKTNHLYLFCVVVCTIYWLSHRPVGSFLSLIVDARAGGSSAFGSICGIGAAVESMALLGLARIQKSKKASPWTFLSIAVLLNILRPLLIQLFPGLMPLYIGQIIQSVSFALFYIGSVACFSEASDIRIRNFSISAGLTFSSVVGTVLANLIGGRLCDFFGAEALVCLSFGIAIGNCVFLFIGRRNHV